MYKNNKHLYTWRRAQVMKSTKLVLLKKVNFNLHIPELFISSPLLTFAIKPHVVQSEYF